MAVAHHNSITNSLVALQKEMRRRIPLLHVPLHSSVCGSGGTDDSAEGVALDSQGGVYIAGTRGTLLQQVRTVAVLALCAISQGPMPTAMDGLHAVFEQAPQC